MYHSIPLLALFLFLLSTNVYSQTQPMNREEKPCEIWGQVAGPARLLKDGLRVELVGQDNIAKQKVPVSSTGNFDLRSVPAGGYQFRIIDSSGAIIHEQAELLDGKQDFILLHIRDPRSELSARNTVSFAALEHKTPGRAWNAFRESQKAIAIGDTQTCILRLQEALSIDPNFAEAHSDLAARYAKMGRSEEALQHAETAFNLNHELPEAGCNLALLQVSLKRYSEAEATARRLLSGRHCLPEMQGVLAISLIGQRRNLDEAFENLRHASTELPFITLLAAHTLTEIGKADLAVIQVRAYLQSFAHECERRELEAWIASVQSQLPSGK